jgi:hypothetical protein
MGIAKISAGIKNENVITSLPFVHILSDSWKKCRSLRAKDLSFCHTKVKWL